MRKSFYLPGLIALCFMLCSASVKAQVPTVTSDPLDTTVCHGIPVYFAVVANDTPSTDPIIYSWETSTDGGFTWSPLSDTLFFSGTGTDTLHVTADTSITGNMYRAIATNTTGADTSLGATLTVNPLAFAGVISGPSAVCKTFSISLSSTQSGGVWSSLNPTIATVGSASGIVTGHVLGLATIQYNYSNVCGSDSVTHTVRVDTTAVAAPILGPGTTCVGNSITLTNANTLGSYTWTTENGRLSVATTGIATGISGGMDTVTYTFTNGCNTVLTVRTINVDVPLTPAVISGPSAVCAGSWMTLTTSGFGGMWISGTTSVAIVDGSGNVTGINQGTSVISYYLSNACGAAIGTHTVTVEDNASVITGGDSVGVGATLALFDSVTGGTWTSNDTTIATITSGGVVTGVAVGTTTITYAVTNICGTSYAYLTLYVGLPPYVSVVSGPASVCVGNTITLTDSVTGGTWSIATGDSVNRASVSATGVVTGLAYGYDTVYYTVTTAFGSTTVSKVIFVNSTPVITLTGPSIVAVGGNYFFRGIPYGGTFTSTNVTGVFVSFTDSLNLVSYGSYVVLRPGTDVIHYRVTNECGLADSSFTISLAAESAVKNFASATSGINVYPNPNNGAFMLNLNTIATEEATVAVTNVLGAKVKDFTITTNKNYNVNLDIPSGVYMVTATSASGQYSTKVTISK